ncbi:MAG: hypothetical protein AAGA67_00080 [Cyanobacteria bacterium P01_F01_bin.153]
MCQDPSDYKELIRKILQRIAAPSPQLTIISKDFGKDESSNISKSLELAIIQEYPRTAFATTVPILMSRYPGGWPHGIAGALFHSPAHLPAMLQDIVAFSLSSEFPIEESSESAKSEIWSMLSYWKTRDIKVVLIFDQFESCLNNLSDQKDRVSLFEFLEKCIDYTPLLEVVIFIQQQCDHYLMDWPMAVKVLGDNTF